MAQTNPEKEQRKNVFVEVARELDSNLIDLQLKQFSKSKHTAINKIILELKKERTTVTEKVVVFSSDNIGLCIIAAKMVATELDMPLHLFDLPMVLSDEDEDINALFAAAANVEGILLIESADVLFGVETDSEIAVDMTMDDVLKALEDAKGIIILTCDNYEATPVAETKAIKLVFKM